MNLAGYTIRHQAVTCVAIFMLLFGGVRSYQNLGRLEDPEFTIKTAIVATQYPGATAEEVEAEVTEPIETALQQLKQLDEVTSISRAGLSIVYAEMKDLYDKDTLPQVWDELRRKVGEASLPPGCQEPVINDDFGDVYGIFLALTGAGYTPHELEEVAEDLQRELLLCEDVGRIELWGLQQEVIYVEINRAKIKRLGISLQQIFNTINAQNTVLPTGHVNVGSEYDSIRISGLFTSVEDMGDLLISGGTEHANIRLREIAKITRGIYEPSVNKLFYDGQEAVGIGISTVSGGNVIRMGDSVKSRLQEIESSLPMGMDVHYISCQSDTVNQAVEGFVLNLLEALAIVILLLVIFMGKREGFIIGTILLLTILATFIGMQLLSVNLQRISLGALIIALGMLVDNAIVVAEGIVLKLHAGKNPEEAAEETVSETQWPLLGATIIAILAFAAISISKDVTGEFLGSLFQVIALSLGLSWIFAVTLTPFLCVKFLSASEEGEKTSLYDTPFYRIFRRFLHLCIQFRWLSLGVTLLIFIFALWGFGFVKHDFFPSSNRPQFMLSIWLPEGTHIDETKRQVLAIGEAMKEMDGITHLTTFCGQGGLRFILTYDPEMPSSNYAQILADVEDADELDRLIGETSAYLKAHYPSLIFKTKRFVLGPGGGAIEARFSGEDANTLRDLAEKTQRIFWENDNTQAVRSDWGNKVKVVNVEIDEAHSLELGVTRRDVAQALHTSYSGSMGGIYRDGNDLIPVMLRLPESERQTVNDLPDMLVPSSGSGRYVPLSQITNQVDLGWENPVIHRRDRKRTITVSCEPISGTTADLFAILRPQVDALDLPQGSSLEWGGEYERSREANQKLMAKVPLAFAMMFLISVMLFNTLRHPLIIFMGLPLALIGVTAGLLLADQPFGFMATLGFLSLAGMLIKNEIVLLEQVNIEISSGKSPLKAVLDSTVSRVRPVSMAAFTTVLGMIPLLWDKFFAAMAVTIMGGLTFATCLTLLFVPVLYSALFKIKGDA